MLNMISTDKMPDMKYEKMTRQFLNNTLAFTYGHITKDTSSFDPMVLAEMKKDPDWLEAAAGETQSIIIQSLEGNENFENPEQLKEELSALIKLYFVLGKRNHTDAENQLLLSLHDKFTLLLLSSDHYIQFLKEMESAL